MRVEHLQRLAVTGKMTAAIAHELSQLLTAVGNNLDTAANLLNSANPRLDELGEIISDIGADVGRAREIISRIRSFVLMREARMELLDLNSVVADTLDLLADDARKRGVRVRAELPPGILLVIGDRTQLQQVLINSAVNGMDAKANTPRAAPCLTVQTRPNGDAHVEVAVVDSGDGVAPDHLPHLFEAFFTTKSDGMGFGLFLARSMVESHRGRIWPENNPRRGAIFHFTILMVQNQSKFLPIGRAVR